jgi:hypothetical protein
MMVAARFNILTFLVKYLSSWFTRSGLQVASPPRDTSMGQGRDDGDGGLVIFAATGRKEALAGSVVEGKSSASSTLPFLYNILPSLGLSRKNTLLGDPKSFALLVGCPSFLHLDTATKTYISIDSFSLLHSKADREGTLHIKYVRTRPPYLPIQGTQDSLALYAAIYHSAFVPLRICPQRSRLMTAPGEITSLVCEYCVGWKYSVFWGLSRDNRSVLDALPACSTQHPRSQLPTMSASRDVQYRAA